MKKALSVLVAGSTLALIAGCQSGPDYPFEVHHPERSVPAATLHTTAHLNIDVPNATHQRLQVEITSINGQRIESEYPVVIPAGIHMLALRCKLYSSDRDADRHQLFYGQQQWSVEPNKTYYIRPAFENDAYDNPVCKVQLRAAV